jgi:hypothetical protein
MKEFMAIKIVIMKICKTFSIRISIFILKLIKFEFNLYQFFYSKNIKILFTFINCFNIVIVF